MLMHSRGMKLEVELDWRLTLAVSWPKGEIKPCWEAASPAPDLFLLLDCDHAKLSQHFNSRSGGLGAWGGEESCCL